MREQKSSIFFITNALWRQKVNCLLYYTYIGRIYVHIIRNVFCQDSSPHLYNYISIRTWKYIILVLYIRTLKYIILVLHTYIQIHFGISNCGLDFFAGLIFFAGCIVLLLNFLRAACILHFSKKFVFLSSSSL